MATVAVVFWFSNRMAEIFPEIELEEIQELKKKMLKTKTRKLKAQKLVLEGKARSLREATKSSLPPRVTEELIIS